MHPTELLILKYLLRRNISKHVTLNIMSRISYKRHYCSTRYDKCKQCKEIIQTCRKCETQIKCRFCDNVFCKSCGVIRDKRKLAFVCDDCYCACHSCGNISNHTCRQCGYELCYECYRYKKIEYIAGDYTYEICYNCRKRC